MLPQRLTSQGVSSAVGTPVKRPIAAIAPISAVDNRQLLIHNTH